ncbi:ATP-dependent DNA helicase PIF1-like isoform X2 [Ischnura elegans]|uniref:ATP-dependent DNA helicase PIF1-like isoform X1 n=2 Tax=Ischnura elegans TaxID=197161 RepID=UPI001ED899E5|nr:ATP-dependent DNA helicase PIF1-like isoform X1 [Ischnura elegans]XP_046393362.1 ATP-dependent DNA helicase PIF1-like isoform X2 [Ischnura elegans]
MVAPSDGFLRFICLDKQIRMFKDQCLQARSSFLQEFLLEIKQATEKQLLDAGFEQNPQQSSAQVDSGGYDGPATFCFQSSAWERCGLESYEVQEVHRQRDPEFVSILQSIRIGRVKEEISEKLTSTISNQVEEGGILATRLCSHTKDADQINQSRLMELPGKVFME